MKIDMMMAMAMLHAETDLVEILADCEDVELVDVESEKGAEIASVSVPGYLLA